MLKIVEKALGGRDSAPNPAGGTHTALQTPSWWGGVAAPSPRTSPSPSALRTCPPAMKKIQDTTLVAEPPPPGSTLPPRVLWSPNLVPLGQTVTALVTGLKTTLGTLTPWGRGCVTLYSKYAIPHMCHLAECGHSIG